MDLVNDPAVREIWVMKSAQVGWTEILLNVIGYYVDLDPSPILLIQPTLELAEAFSKDRLAPMIRDTPALTGKFADPKSRDSGNTLLHKKYNGGHITLAGANSPSSLASRPIRILLCDEIDRYPTSAGAEGDPFALARKRTTAFWNRKILAGSTPTIKGQSRVEAGYLNSDQRHFEFPCPYCGEFQRLVWAQVKWTEIGLPPEEAHYQCVHCGELWSDVQRREVLPLYRVVATKPFNGIAGLHINELMSPFVTLGEMATSFVEAKKLPETWQTWVNTALGETWADTAKEIDGTALAKRREAYGPQAIPKGVLMLTLGVDTQDDRLEAQLVGWGADEECWVIEHKRFPGDPGVAWNRGVWKALTEYRHQLFATEDGRTLAIQATGVDFGGHYSQHVADYCYRYRFQRVFAVKGAGGQGRLVWPKKPGKTKLSKADIYSIGVDTIKDVLYGRLVRITVPGPGYIHLPASVDDEWCEGLTSETKEYHKVKGRRVAVWRPKRLGIRQEPLDCWNYAYAVMRGRGVDLNRLAKALERRRGEGDPSPPMSAPDTPPMPPTETGSEFEMPGAAGPAEASPAPQAEPSTDLHQDEPTPPTPPAAPPRPRKKRRLIVARSNYLRR